MAIPGANNQVQRNYFNRCIDGVGRFMRERSPTAQVLAAGSATLLFNTVVVAATELIPNPVFKITARVISPLALWFAAAQIAKNRGVQLENTALGLGCSTGLIQPIAEGVGPTQGIPSYPFKLVFSAAFGTRAAKVLQRYPEPRNCLKTALTIAGLIAADMLIGGSGSLVAGASGALAAASMLLASRFPGLMPQE